MIKLSSVSVTGRFVFSFLYLKKTNVTVVEQNFLQFSYQKNFIFYTKITTQFIKLFFMQKHLFAIKVNMHLCDMYNKT